MKKIRLMLLQNILTILILSVCFSSSTAAEDKIRKDGKVDDLNRRPPIVGWPKDGEKSQTSSNIARFVGMTSLLRIVSCPEKYDGRFVITEGFLVGHSLYQNEVDAKKSLFLNSILLRVKPNAVDASMTVKANIASMNSTYVMVEGVFSQWDRVPDQYPNGSLSVSRIFPTGVK
jgi:hypothetical protein